MIDLKNETTITLTQAARLLPPSRRGRPVTLSCILRWLINGVRTASGVVRLEGMRLGGRWLTSEEALQRFADRQTPNLDGTATIRTPTKRRRASEAAAKQLEKIGI